MMIFVHGDYDEAKILDLVACVMCFSMFGACLSLIRGSAAPYGRYWDTRNFGTLINGKLAWIVQEAPSLLVPLVLYAVGPTEVKDNLANRILLGMFVYHYFHRTVVYPLQIRGGKPTPLGVALSALCFTALNGYMQGKYLTAIHAFEDDYVYSTRFWVGSALFLIGMAINRHSDHVLRNLRKPGETGYKIPHGGMFRYVSGANFLGEIIEWAGFAIACGGVPAITFALNTAFNIGPRAVQHHRWYLGKFDDYERLGRTALIPFLL